MENHIGDNLTGAVLSGRFQILKLIGQGGMANVYLAQDGNTGNQVAIKVLKQEYLSDVEFVRRFDIEAQAAASLNHPNIVKVFGIGKEPNIRYMVQEYIDGVTLKDMIDQYGKLSWSVAVPIVIQIAYALEHAHFHGIVHRDIKPQNIMITKDHRALVTDFGIARATTTNTITMTGGNTIGSVHYFSPEQARGGIVGAKADIYSLGILFYEILTGRLPFEGDTSVSIALMHLQQEAIPPIQVEPKLPVGLNNIVLKCIRKNVSDRYASTRDLIDELEAFLANPNGQYGITVDGYDNEPTAFVPTIYTQDVGSKKVRYIEQSIYDRKKKHRREVVLAISLILLCFTLVVFFLVYVLKNLGNQTPTYESDQNPKVVGQYIGLNLDQAKTMLDSLDIPFDTAYKDSDQPRDTVINQSISPSSVLKAKRLTLTLSKGSSLILVADYVGKNYESIAETFKALDLTVIPIQEYNKDVPEGEIIRTDPVATTEVKPNSKLTVYVSRGVEMMTIPVFPPNTYWDKARAILDREDLIYTVRYEKPYYQSIPDDSMYIVSMSPDQGEEIEEGESIDILLTFDTLAPEFDVNELLSPVGPR